MATAPPSRERVAAAARRLADDGLVLGTAGNVSERAGRTIAVTPTGASLATVTAEQVVLVDVAGDQLEGELAPTSELELHLEIYRRCEAGAVVHTHPPMGTALGCVLDELPVVHYQLLELGGPVRVASYATFGTSELAELTLQALRGRSAALMSNHGAVAYGSNLEVAVQRSMLLEWACSIYWHAASIGSPRTLDRQQQAAYRQALADRGYRALEPMSGEF